MYMYSLSLMTELLYKEKKKKKKKTRISRADSVARLDLGTLALAVLAVSKVHYSMLITVDTYMPF